MDENSKKIEPSKKKLHIKGWLAAVAGTIALLAAMASNLSTIFEFGEKIISWNILQDNNEITLSSISTNGIPPKQCDKFRHQIYSGDKYDYSLYILVTIKYKNSEFNNSRFLCSLLDFKSKDKNLNSHSQVEEIQYPINKRKEWKENIEDIKDVKHGIYLKSKKKPNPNSYLSFSTGPKTWRVKYGSLDWFVQEKANGKINSNYYSAYATVQLLVDDPNWIILHSARIRELEQGNNEEEVKALLDVVIENRSSIPVALSDINISAIHDRGYRCSAVAGAKPAPWEEISINWEKVLASEDEDNSASGLATLSGEKLITHSTYRSPTCSNNYEFKVSVPVIINIQPKELKRVVFKVNEIPYDFSKPVESIINVEELPDELRKQFEKIDRINKPPNTLREWDIVYIGIGPDDNVFPKKIAAY